MSSAETERSVKHRQSLLQINMRQPQGWAASDLKDHCEGKHSPCERGQWPEGCCGLPFPVSNIGRLLPQKSLEYRFPEEISCSGDWQAHLDWLFRLKITFFFVCITYSDNSFPSPTSPSSSYFPTFPTLHLSFSFRKTNSWIKRKTKNNKTRNEVTNEGEEERKWIFRSLLKWRDSASLCLRVSFVLHTAYRSS